MISGLVLLIVGAEILVRAAVRLAASLKVRPLIIGLTIVAFGSSAPQMTVSLQATLAGNTDIAVGSVIGSSIFNILVTLGPVGADHSAAGLAAAGAPGHPGDDPRRPAGVYPGSQ